MASPDPRPTITRPDDDPWIWLENIDGPKAHSFVEKQNKRTMATFGNAAFEQDRNILAAIFDRPDNIPFVTRRGSKLFNFWKDQDNPRGLWRTTTLQSYASKQPDWTIILDLDELAKKEDEDWIWSGATTLPGSHDRAILRLSRGGGDAVVLREFDLASKSFVKDGFHLAEAKSNASWLDRDSLILSSALGDNHSTKSGYARTTRVWRRGQTIDQAEQIFETNSENVALWSMVDHSRSRHNIWFTERLGFFDAVYRLGDQSGPKIRIDLPTDISLDLEKDWLVVQRRTQWQLAGQTHKPGTVLAISFERFLEGKQDFNVLFDPGDRQSVQQFFWCDGELILSILDNLQPVFEKLTPRKLDWTRSKIQGLPEIGVVSIMSLDAEQSESNGQLLAITQDPVTPHSLSLLDPHKSPTLLKQAPQVFNADGLMVTQHEATSSDGEKIPYVQVGPPVRLETHPYI